MNKKLLCWLILYFILIGLSLNNTIPNQWDESYYLISGINMIKTQNYIIPNYYSSMRLQKPILAYWITAAGYKIFGIHLWSGRIFFLFFSILLLFVVYKFALLIKNDNQFAFLNVLLLSSSAMYILFSRAAMTDLLLTFFITLSLYYFYKSISSPLKLKKFYFLAYLCMGFAFLSKGIIGLSPFLIMLIYLVYFKPENYKKYILNLLHPLNIIVFVFIAFSWYIYILVFYKNVLLNQLITEVPERFKFSIKLVIKKLIYYLGVVIRYYFPFTLAAFYLYIKKRSKSPYLLKLLFLYTFIIFIIFIFFVGMYRSRYLLPIFPVITILISFIIYKNNLLKIMQKIAVIFFLIQIVFLLSLPIIQGEPMKELALYCKKNKIKNIHTYNIKLRNQGWLEIFLHEKTTKNHDNGYIIINDEDFIKFKNFKIIKKVKQVKKVKLINGKITKKFQQYYLIKGQS